ncbi:hypothetical protein [Brachybacterium sp. NPDC056505]|uniref:hypothetical protein n=1 Tax=Brachybacterium sp. NPDC056505 TaxID=3345843 RepID=UPI00366E97A1
MNTVTVYAARARAIRKAARATASTFDPADLRALARLDGLWNLASRIEDLANTADGPRVTSAFRNTSDDADTVARLATTAHDLRHLQTRVANGEQGLGHAIARLTDELAGA